MSQFYDQASLVMLPSGYKSGKIYSQKPLSTSGELSFSRASNATRVVLDASGQQRLEKVRTNLILQSNTFSTTWTNSNSTETSGQAGYDGTNNAWLLQATNIVQARLTQTQTTNGLQTFSVYAKAGTSNFLILEKPNLGTYLAWFDLSNGTLGTVIGGTATITSVGSGWYRCTINGTPTASADVRIFVADGNGSSAVTIGGNIYIQNAQLETGDIATDYIATTTTSVSVGPVSGLPRLDYSGGASCPSLLLEPQRTNIQLNSEDFSQANWSKTNSVIVTNQVASPDGYLNADKLNETAVNNIHQLESSRSVSSSTVYTMSVFAKKAERSWVRIYEDTTSNSAYFNLDSGTVGTVGGPTATAKIEAYSNGWYRCSVTYTETGTFGRYRIANAKQDNEASYLGVVNNGIYVWGAQYELGAYATSYIGPTYSSAVTRVADAASKTGISSLIGQTEGTLFAEVKATFNTRNGRFMLVYGTTNNFIELVGLANGKVQAFVYNGSTQANIQSTSTYSTGDTLKIAFAYKSNDFVLYVNGTQQGTDTSGAIPSSMSNLIINNYTATGYDEANAYKQALLFTSRLSNADLATLTTL